MTENNLAKLLDEAIRLELLVADLYALFNEKFPEDGPFWWKLSLEEMNHAALLKSGRDHFLPVGQFPLELASSTIDILSGQNRDLVDLLDRYRHHPPSRAEAFLLAHGLETSAAELHFQHAMEKHPQTPAMQIFRSLNSEDLDHAQRILEYMKGHGIS